MLWSLWLLPLARSFVANAPPPQAHRRATPSGVEEKETPELDWRAFRAKLEGAGLDAADREEMVEKAPRHEATIRLGSVDAFDSFRVFEMTLASGS